MIGMDFRIFVFLAAARHLNFTKAAREANISQPAVSKNIHELELQTGRNLFQRNGRKLSLTEAGRILYDHALRMNALYVELNDHLDLLDGGLSDELCIGASTTLSHYIIPQILAAFHQSFPHTHIKILHGNSSQVEGWLEDRSIDLGIVEGLSDNSSMKYEPFLKDEIVLVTRKGNPKLMGGDTIAPDNLRDLEFVIREQGSGTNDVIQKALIDIGIEWDELDVRIVLASTESIKNFLSETDCFSFLSIHAVTKELHESELAIVEIEGFQIDRDFFFVRPQGVIGRRPNIFRKFIIERFSPKHRPEQTE